jgi:glucose-6-phosphate 1-dehydrogenase
MRKVPPCTVVIWGASGDLTQRKLVPALHTMACEGFLPPEARVIGVARTEMDDPAFRDHLYEGVKDYARLKPGVCEAWPQFAERITYLHGDYDDPNTYHRLAECLDGLGEVGRNRLFYLATPPTLYGPIAWQLGQAGLCHSERGWMRLIVEKPFGRDRETARALNDLLHVALDEDQIYRIDHYLGKETVQNLMTFRFSNTIMEPLWNRNYVDNVQITVAEDLGVEHRGPYYDKSGVLRDMFQNHLLQLLTLTALEPPSIFDADALRDEKAKVLRAVRPIARSVRGQYRRYRDEPGVAPSSHTATYAALEVFIDNWRWQGVPFYLRSGKALKAKTSQIVVQYKRPPQLMFPMGSGERLPPNTLSLCIQPDEGVHFQFLAKQPGQGMRTRSVNMDFHYAEGFADIGLPEAYERLLMDAMNGDASRFARADEIELAWGLVDPVIASWHGAGAPPLSFYESGTWGPPEAEAFLAAGKQEGDEWIYGCEHADNA